jgi:5S rRNA maturation endonuclease (ribonuclease M5)
MALFFCGGCAFVVEGADDAREPSSAKDAPTAITNTQIKMRRLKNAERVEHSVFILEVCVEGGAHS